LIGGRGKHGIGIGGIVVERSRRKRGDAQAVRAGYARALQEIRDEDYTAAVASLETILPILERLGDLLGQARVLTNLGQIDELEERFDRAERHFRQALDLAMQVGDIRLQALTAHQLAHRIRSKQPEAARELFQQSATACLALRDRRGRALSLAMVGQIDFTAGHHESGLRQMHDALLDLPEDAPERTHLIEHIIYFCRSLDPANAPALLRECILDREIRSRIVAALKA
jgi:tetratricopeptide (TPR) repeat protein